MDDVRTQSTIGERIRQLRNDVLMTQDDLAAAAGVSTDLIRKLEQGRRHTASIGSLHRIAAALDVDLGELLGRDNMPDAAPDAGVMALRQAVADITDLLGDVEGEPLSLRDAERSVTYLWGAYWSGRYDQLTGLIPQALIGLRAMLHAANTVTRSKAAEQLAWGYWVAGSTLTHLLQPDAAFMAVRRAVDLAANGDDALLAAALKGSLSWQLMVSGRFAEAERVAVRTAESIEPSGNVPVQDLSAYGSLLVTAATAAARDDRRVVAGDFLQSAGEVAQRLGADRVDYETPFGPSQVTMQTVDVNVVTEDYPAALSAASRMPTNPGLPLAARCRHLTDRACAHANLDEEEQALALLLTAEGMSPDWIRHQTLARAVTRDLLTAERTRSTPLRQLAKRIGVNR
ncbi:MAG TPA: helix-turn-helix domain-containing protein [Pseudonocardiaceae bacterium]|jgi:transcriptional regulator with XRE-family HTH domain|nr:helix-turn-helix domain-containing protein [Pseudonocardiaceae bacterium]